MEGVISKGGRLNIPQAGQDGESAGWREDGVKMEGVVVGTKGRVMVVIIVGIRGMARVAPS